MKYKRVLLIQPPYAQSHYTYTMRPPAGLGYIAEALKRNDIEYEILDMGLNHDFRDMKKKIDAFEPDIVGVSMMTSRYKNTYTIIKKIKEISPNVSIVVGGPHVSTIREKALLEVEEIDYGVVLEGEETLLELCEGKSVSEIKGLIYRDGKEVVYNGDRPFIKDLDSVNFPAYDKFEIDRYAVREICIVSSRGCPYNCIYCPVKSTIGKKFRMRSAKSVADELEYWYKRGYKRFDFVDDNFTLIKERVYEICNEIEKRGLNGLKLHCGNGIRADKVDRDILKRMKHVGFDYIAFGVEAGNNKILNNIKKGESIEAIENSIKTSCELGFDVTLFFLVGSPGETWNDIMDSVNLALKYPVSDVRFYNIMPFPNTELYNWLEENDYFVKEPGEYLNSGSAWVNDPVFITPQLSYEERKRALNFTKSIEIKVKKNHLARRLKMYGIFGRLFSEFYFTKIVYGNVQSNKLLNKIAITLSNNI